MIGRKHEQHLLAKALEAKEAQFIAVYGRRRVGKTFLVREFFAARKCRLMRATGLEKGSRAQQLENFAQALAATFAPGLEPATPASWMEAFKHLTQLVLNAPGRGKTVVFLDEFPWMATRKSGLLEALDYYWNQHWSTLPGFILVVCGSSASWLIKNIIYNKGGLHNRITSDIRLEPFSLAESIEFLQSKKIRLSNRQVLALYMALGGIPYYLNYLDRTLSVEQNIQQIFFAGNAPLRDEFKKLFNSLFKNATAYVELVKLIGAKQEGASRTQLAAARLSQGGGQLSERLHDLAAAGFIEELTPWNRTRGEYYKLVDGFSLFYLRWVAPARKKRVGKDYWITQSGKPAYKAWAGYAFENVCLSHIEQIFAALRVPAGSMASSWRFAPRTRTDSGAQIDLLIERDDDAITLCEIKHTHAPFVIDKACALNLTNKMETFRAQSGTKKQIFLAVIAAAGLKKNAWSDELVSAVVTADDLCH